MKACVTSKILSKDTSGKTVPFEETLQFVKQAGFEEIDMGLEAPALTGPGWESALYDRIRLCERDTFVTGDAEDIIRPLGYVFFEVFD